MGGLLRWIASTWIGRVMAAVVLFVGSLAVARGVGYRAGYKDREDEHEAADKERAAAVRRRADAARRGRGSSDAAERLRRHGRLRD
mgnify:CR=1 FL=1